MSTLANSTDVVIKLHGAAAIKEMLKQKPLDATLIAINQYKYVSIFYKKENDRFYADYTNGKGWEKSTCQHDQQELIQDLASYSFILADIAALEAALADSVGEQVGNPIKTLKSQVDAQFIRVGLRREHETNKDGYWRGQYDAYEIVQHMIRKIS